ncbi:MAG TPA: SDR family NAD(P)-dependent oxidoreductase [Azospirillaceae bacterium]|nr:SDR family NAD(P)-dependent oxidoreductase [Azospirillaceae bacterium]
MQETTTIAGRHAAVTGGSRGIGFAVAEALVRQGARVTILGRDRARLADAAARLGPGAQGLAADVADGAALTAAMAEAARLQGPVDILVNNAGGAESVPFRRMVEEDFRRMLDLNLVSAFTATRAVLPGMLDRGWGRVVNVASTAGLKGYAYVAHYCAAKHGLVGLTRALAVELARTAVTVNAVCPGYTDTDLLRGAVANVVAKTGLTPAEAMARMTADNPQGRPVRPEEVAAAVLWLCGPGSDSVTGQSISVSGGEVT